MILIDDRTGSLDLLTILPAELCQKSRLEAADAAFMGYGPEGPFTYPIGIECKTASEALTCMHTGRLEGEQLPKLSALYKISYGYEDHKEYSK